MTAPFDLLCIGNPCADVVIRCERLPSWDDKCEGGAVGSFAGGTESNVACAASRLGWKTAVLGEIGDDAHAAFLFDAFQRDAVSTRWVTHRPATASASTVVFVSSAGERSIVWVPMPRQPWPPADLGPALAGTRRVYTMPYDADALEHLHALSRPRGVEVAIDVEREAARHAGLLQRLLAHCDVAFLNETGYTAALGRPPDEAGVQALRAQSAAHTLVVTLGARGAIAADAGGVARAAAQPVPVIDTTGAGDSFNAAFLVGRDRGMALAHALQFACAVAARTVGALGARTAVPHWRDMAQDWALPSGPPGSNAPSS